MGRALSFPGVDCSRDRGTQLLPVTVDDLFPRGSGPCLCEFTVIGEDFELHRTLFLSESMIHRATCFLLPCL